MRTRTSGLATPPLSSPAAAAKQRKRDARSLSPSHFQDELANISAQGEITRRDDILTTPRRPAKRVRFSDPGPETLSSGLTPRLRRSTLFPKTSTASTSTTTPQTKSRASLSPSLPTPNSSPLAPIIQYVTPLKQTLGDRTKRRLRRSHLSEELNDYEQEHRAEIKARHELAQLRDEDAKKDERIQTLMWELESQRQFGIELNNQEETHVQNLQRELAELREGRAAPPLLESAADMEDDNEQVNNNIFDGVTPWEEETFFSSPTGYLHRSAASSASVCTETLDPETTDQCCQVSMTDPNHDLHVQALEQAVVRLTQDSSDAKAAVDILRGELRTMGFSTEEHASADNLIVAIRDAFRKARLDLEYLLPGETQGGLEDGKLLLESFLLHLKFLLDKVRSQEILIDRQNQAEAALRGQFNGVLEKLAYAEQTMAEIISHRTQLITGMEQKDQMLEALRDKLRGTIDQSEIDGNHIQELEKARHESSVSIERLQAALQSYREEVKSLESLITKMEEEKATLSNTVHCLVGVNTDLENQVVEAEKRSEELMAAHDIKVTQLRNDLDAANQELTALSLTLENERNIQATKLSDAHQQHENLQTKYYDNDSKLQYLQTKHEELNCDLQETRRHLVSHISQVQSLLTGALQGYKQTREASELFLQKGVRTGDGAVVMSSDAQDASEGVDDDGLLTLAAEL